MLSLFPFLFDFSFFAPTIIRVTLGATVGLSGVALLKELRETGTLNRGIAGVSGFIHVLLGGLFIIGAYTQAAALITALIGILGVLFLSLRLVFAHRETNYYVFLLGTSFALLLLGPGAFALDVPL